MDVCQNNNPSTSGLDQQQLQLVPMNLAMDNGNIINTAATTALRMAKRQRDPVDEEHILTNELNNQLPSSNTTFYFPAYPGMMQQYKRSAGDKNSAAQNMAAVYQQHQQSAANASHQAAMTAAAYQAQALMQLQQQPYGVPVSFTGHPPGLPRF